MVADAQTLQEENLSEKGSVESARRLNLVYRKSSIKPPGAYIALDTPEGGGGYQRGGLLERGAHSQNQMTIVFAPNLCISYHIKKISKLI